MLLRKSKTTRKQLHKLINLASKKKKERETMRERKKGKD